MEVVPLVTCDSHRSEKDIIVAARMVIIQSLTHTVWSDHEQNRHLNLGFLPLLCVWS